MQVQELAPVLFSILVVSYFHKYHISLCVIYQLTNYQFTADYMAVGKAAIMLAEFQSQTACRSGKDFAPPVSQI